MDALEITSEFRRIYQSSPVDDLEESLLSICLPVVRGMCAYFSTVLSLYFDDLDALSNLVAVLMETFAFNINGYPEVNYKKKSQQVLWQAIYKHFWKNYSTTVHVFRKNFLLTSRYSSLQRLTRLGARILPLFNEYINDNFLQSFPHFNQDFQRGKYKCNKLSCCLLVQESTFVYPGDDWCNATIPHANVHCYRRNDIFYFCSPWYFFMWNTYLYLRSNFLTQILHSNR